MSLWKIAWRSIQQRSLPSLLTTISMALGVTLVVAVLVIYVVVDHAFNRGGGGYDLIVGPPKGSNQELVLSNVFFIGQPTTPLPYSVYRDLLESRYRTAVEAAVPICLGDVYQDKRVVGTTPAMFELEYGTSHEGKEAPKVFEFAQGAPFDGGDWFAAVAGANAARDTGLKLGDSFRPTHDANTKSDESHGAFKVVGILKPSGTPNDNVLFVNIEGFYRVGGHAGHAGPELKNEKPAEKGTAKPATTAATAGEPKPSDEPRDMSPGARPPESGITNAHAGHDEDEHAHAEIPDSQKQVSAVLVCTYGQSQTRDLVNEINKTKEAQAAVPAQVIDDLLKKIVGNIEVVLLVFAIMIVLVAGIGIMVSIYNSMNDRRHEIAIMRALGARRSTVMVVILLESILLSLGGGVLGLGLGHGLLTLAGPWIAELVNLPLRMLQFNRDELWIVPALIALASIVGYLPAVAAYRTDVGKSLISNP